MWEVKWNATQEHVGVCMRVCGKRGKQEYSSVCAEYSHVHVSKPPHFLCVRTHLRSPNATLPPFLSCNYGLLRHVQVCPGWFDTKAHCCCTKPYLDTRIHTSYFWTQAYRKAVGPQQEIKVVLLFLKWVIMLLRQSHHGSESILL